MLVKSNRLPLFVMIFLLILSGCYTILNVAQPNTVAVSQKITTHLFVQTQPDTNGNLNTTPYHQIVSIELPTDWTVDSVYFIGTDISPDTGYFEFLPENQPDADPSREDFWTRDLEIRYPTSDNMHWVTYQSFQPVVPQVDTTYNNVYIEMTAGNIEGDYSLGYFVTNGHLDFYKDYYYSITRGHAITVTGASGIKNAPIQPKRLSLAQNYPNPFNSRTTIRFFIPVAQMVTLDVLSSDGRLIRKLAAGFKTAGDHLLSFDATGLASGVYLYKLQAGAEIQVRKMILLN